MSETNSEELQLFVGLLKTALVREHAVLPQFILATRICGAGNWTAAAELARSLTQLSEEFLESITNVAIRNDMIPAGKRLFPRCHICGGSWCYTGTTRLHHIVHKENFVMDNKNKDKES